ncbi:pyridoxamine 5'-phosphate oxidase family protein [Streptomyces sp. NPDC059979]|uniref:pyridoxamine 5'-phosphate oxidase family protein n=1 Tax=Streptomyces sp. NPDC059979 TaxID=3347021 RepID=UPI0036C6BEBC
MRELDRAEALRLLSTVSLGRIVFTQHALPAVRPVNHLVVGENIMVGIHEDGRPAPCGSALIVSPDSGWRRVRRGPRRRSGPDALAPGLSSWWGEAPARRAWCPPRRESRG